MNRRERRRIIVSVGIAVGAAALLSLALIATTLDRLQSLAVDYLVFQSWQEPGVKQAASNVVIIAIDTPSLRQLGRFGDWPRRYYAQVVDRMRETGARVIALDVGFIESQADDALVIEAFERFKNISREDLQRIGLPLNRRSVISPVIGTSLGPPVLRDGEPPLYPTREQPQPIYVDASTALGHANVHPDKDGTVRKTPLIVKASDEIYPSLALAAAAAYTNTLGLGFKPDPEAHRLLALNRIIPVDQFGQMLISFAGPPSRIALPEQQTFKVVSFVDAMEGRVDPLTFADKMVFVGLLDAAGFADDFNAPTSSGLGKMHGVELHANSFATLLSARVLTEQQLPVTIAIIWIFALLTGLIVFRLNIVQSSLITLAAGALYVFGARLYTTHYFDQLGTAIPNVIYPPAALLLTLFSVTAYRVLFEQSETRATRAAMGKYLSPAILNEVLKDPGRLRLSGEKRIMTCLFTDIRGFTTISERLDPETLVRILNEYLTEMTNIVHQWQGVLDKYMGDAIMAWWGAPTDQPDHAYRACMTAIEMRAKLRMLHDRWQDTGLPQLEMGVGINTGPMVYGNTGSNERFDFTVLGDSVNLASRLEGVNKEYGSNIIITEMTYANVKDRDLVVRFLDVIEVMGKTEPVGIYELLGTQSSVGTRTPDLLDAWDAAIRLYRAQDFTMAADAFSRVLDIDPFDGPSHVYIHRCIDLGATPPPTDWDGVFVMTHK
ncbi:MAG: adenylate cyclase [Chloroflexi bacterium]|nr:adenylate cyclase [Chloroflexota bacterium]